MKISPSVMSKLFFKSAASVLPEGVRWRVHDVGGVSGVMWSVAVGGDSFFRTKQLWAL